MAMVLSIVQITQQFIIWEDMNAKINCPRAIRGNSIGVGNKKRK
jgi:hypothetical protein